MWDEFDYATKHKEVVFSLEGGVTDQISSKNFFYTVADKENKCTPS